MDELHPQSVFFAYGSANRLVSDTMRNAAEILRANQVAAATWEDMAVSGKNVIRQICEQIDSVDCVVAEVSTLNFNVLFEAGYALGRGKRVIPALDDSDVNAVRNWKSFKLMRAVGRIDYSGNAGKLASTLLNELPSIGEELLLDALLAGAAAKQLNSVFAPASPVPTTAFDGLSKLLERSPDWTTHSSSDDLVLAPLDYYVKEIYRSTAAVISILGSTRSRAEEHNARASFLAGVALGMELPVLLVAESGFESPFDYQDLLYEFDSARGLQEAVEQWLSNQYSTSSASGKRSGRLALSVELPLQSFGQYVAELEQDELADYFVPTSEFNRMLSAQSEIFVGRKGTGKTATMQRVADELRLNDKNLVVAVKPASYELSGLIEVINDLAGEASTEYMLLCIWSYLVYTEVARQVVRFQNSRPAGWPEDPAVTAVRDELSRMGVDPEDDLSARLEHVVEDLKQRLKRTPSDEREAIARILRVEHIRILRTRLAPSLSGFERVAVLFDNLDKAWTRGADYPAMSRFILSLLVASGKIERELRRDAKSSDGPSFSVGVFLRTDIFDIVTRYAREPDKIGSLEVRWRDEELLLRVLEERFEALRMPDKSGVTPNMWAEIFAPEVRGLNARDYLAWRVLARPRDLVYFANSALTYAVNKKHTIVSESDFISAESDYSEFAIEALLVESQSEPFDLEAVLYEFAGSDCTLSERELLDILGRHGSAEDILNWLVRAAFFGVEVTRDHFAHLEGETRATMRLKVARQNATKDRRQVTFRIHPAFRPFLEIKDSDLHDGQVRDVTLLRGEP